MPDLSPAQFVAKWKRAELSERAASQEHFIDLCNLLGQPTPAGHDATGAEYTFEKGIAIAESEAEGDAGGRGFADVWWRGKFAWEYKRKGKHPDLTAAYKQLSRYREALENPPLLIVSDIARTEIHTNFTGTAKQVHTVTLDMIADGSGIALLRRVFTDPQSFKPTVTPEKITAEVAKQFGTLSESLRKRKHDPHDAAHFLMKCMFSLFAEDVELLPRKLFKRTLEQWHSQPAKLTSILTGLFDAMRTGGAFGPDPIAWFNGGLFDESPALDLTESDIGVLILAAKQDWASVEPAIFGTLFERSLDPGKRAQIGAHYTSREDIMLVVEPVIMAPLRQQWEAVRAEVESQLERRRAVKTKDTRRKADQAITRALQAFMQRLASLRILDPACGSGNFLYVAIQQLLDLEKEVITFAARPNLAVPLLPNVRPTQLLGIEINPYAAELAQVVIWIGYLQWMRDNGFNPPRDPILAPLQTIECRDAILDLTDPKRPKPATWPEADFIIGNPPFLGAKLFRQSGLSEDYVTAMYSAFTLPGNSDLCCYWFEQAQRAVGSQRDTRVGLLATQGIRGDDNRAVLERIKANGDIFFAWADRDWVLDGASVHVSMIGFDSGQDARRVLDGKPVVTINADLTSGLDFSSARRLRENANIYRRSPEKGAKFEIEYSLARKVLALTNPHGESNFAVVHPWVNGKTLLSGRWPDWIIDFQSCGTEATAAQFEAPFEYVEKVVRPTRLNNRDVQLRESWWQFRRSGDGVRNAQSQLPRLLGTSMVAKHRVFIWLPSTYQPDKTITAFARSDDYFFGLLQCSIHLLWALQQGTQLETRPRYTPTSTFETFALPWPPDNEPAKSPACKRISEAAHELNEQRERWQNPQEWIGPIAQTVDALDKFDDVAAASGEEARRLIRESAIMAMAAKDVRLKKRTLTNLYNERPTWLKLLHEKLDRAVLAAYAEVDPAGDWREDWAEVWRDTGAGQPLPADHPLAAKRTETDQRVLANLLRLNHERAGVSSISVTRGRNRS